MAGEAVNVQEYNKFIAEGETLTGKGPLQYEQALECFNKVYFAEITIFSLSLSLFVTKIL